MILIFDFKIYIYIYDVYMCPNFLENKPLWKMQPTPKVDTNLQDSCLFNRYYQT